LNRSSDDSSQPKETGHGEESSEEEKGEEGEEEEVEVG
jgi:hypothetical protein